jgi:hypothetical protein
MIALAFAFALTCGCSLFKHEEAPKPTEIDIPTAEPTAEPVLLEPETIDAFIGDWYGVYRVTEAAGFYIPNANTQNDCAMRVSLDEYGMGSAYLAVNGLQRDAVSGSANVFALCTADVKDGALMIEGMINTASVEWRFEMDGARLKLFEVYGDSMNYMHIEIFLARPDSLSELGFTCDAAEYLAQKGFVGVMDKLGGSTRNLPAVTPPEGYDPHIFFTASQMETPAPVDENSVMSANGYIRVKLPEGYAVVENDVMDFIIANPDERISGVEFIVSAWNTDALSFLLGNTPNVTELYHYLIDGFDFYGTFVEASAAEGTGTVFKLCGTNDTGALIIINITMAMDAYSAYSYVNVDNASFTELILGARFYVD